MGVPFFQLIHELGHSPSCIEVRENILMCFSARIMFIISVHMFMCMSMCICMCVYTCMCLYMYGFDVKCRVSHIFNEHSILRSIFIFIRPIMSLIFLKTGIICFCSSHWILHPPDHLQKSYWLRYIVIHTVLHNNSTIPQ